MSIGYFDLTRLDDDHPGMFIPGELDIFLERVRRKEPGDLEFVEEVLEHKLRIALARQESLNRVLAKGRVK